MTKKVIAIISVLKPIDDTRNYEKIARSIGNTNKYEVNIIGFSTKKNRADPNISFHPVFNFHRTSLKRIGAPYVIFRKLIQLKPELVIVTCPELLAVMYVYKILFGCKVIYDVQENYRKNIRYSSSYPALIKLPLVTVVQAVEWLSRFFVYRYLLAEEVYEKQLHFVRGKSIVIDNKALLNEIARTPAPGVGDKLRLVYSGTISRHYGIFDAIRFTDLLQGKGIDAHLSIIGFSADRKCFRQLTQSIHGKNYITLVGGDTLVPHEQILMEMMKAHFCLLPYQKSKSTEGRIPTKLYECLVMEKPVIITANESWNKLINMNNAGIIHDYSSTVDTLIPLLHRTYFGNNLAHQYQWHNNEARLLSILDRIQY